MILSHCPKNFNLISDSITGGSENMPPTGDVSAAGVPTFSRPSSLFSPDASSTSSSKVGPVAAGLATSSGGQLVETYPGYKPAFVSYDDLPEMGMIICDGCGYAVSEDEFFVCSACARQMCLYCYESGNCREHAFRFSVPRDKFGFIMGGDDAGS